MSSALAKAAPSHIRPKLDSLVAMFRQAEEDDESISPATRPDRSLEALLLRCANLVFASTNSGDLERLIEERSQFDWTIVEEAGKATGVELISPLLPSHRRLLIGDHKQLPPYGADQFIGLRQKPASIRRALDVGKPMVSRPFRDAGMEDHFEEDTETNDDFTSSCSNAAQAFMMFETMVESEFAVARKPGTRRSIAKRLSQQHRMHPAIARLVSTSFYGSSLHTDPTCEQRYRETLPPFDILNTTKLPPSPIVFIDMPFVQSTMGKREIERKPRYHNPEEIDTAIDVLSLLRVKKGQKATLAVLAPYREQVRRLGDRISNELHGRLQLMSEFSFEGGTDTPVGTVDSFQGSEADVVVLSLVRNNARAGLRGLGFLADERRMNVLLSRAKWKLILIGSLQFLQARIQPGPTANPKQLDFLVKMLETLSTLRGERDHRGVPLLSIVPANNLRQ